MNDETRRAALTGELAQVPLWDILQTLQVWPTAGAIDVDGSHELATLHFRAGRIVEARCGLRRGEAAVYRALRLRQGRFSVRRTPDRRDAPLALPITAAILEGVRRHDECERLRATLPGEDELLSWPSGRVPDDLRGHDAAALFVLPRTVDEAVRSSADDELALLEELATLRPRLATRPAFAIATSRASSRPAPDEGRWPPSREPSSPPPLRDDDELVPMTEPPERAAVRDQTTLEPFMYDPPESGAAEPIPAPRLGSTLPSTQALRRLPTLAPRVLAALASAAALASFVVTLAMLPSRAPWLSSLAPEMARWTGEAQRFAGSGNAGPGTAR